MLFQDGKPIGQKTGLIDERQALKYAGVRDEFNAGSVLEPAPRMNLVLNGAQVDKALDDLGALREAVERIPQGEKRDEAMQRVRALELTLSKRAL
jgi:hypothetical protein